MSMQLPLLTNESRLTAGSMRSRNINKMLSSFLFISAFLKIRLRCDMTEHLRSSCQWWWSKAPFSKPSQYNTQPWLRGGKLTALAFSAVVKWVTERTHWKPKASKYFSLLWNRAPRSPFPGDCTLSLLSGKRNFSAFTDLYLTTNLSSGDHFFPNYFKQ